MAPCHPAAAVPAVPRPLQVRATVLGAADSLRLAGNFASSLTTVLQNAQNAISGLYVKDDPS